MNSIRSDNVFLFGTMRDESIIRKKTDIDQEKDECCEKNGIEIFTGPIKTDGINFNSWFTVCRKRPEDEKVIPTDIDLPPELTPIIYSFYTLLGVDYTKRTIYNLIRKLDRFRYTIAYETGAKFENVMEDTIDEKYGIRIKKVISTKEPSQRLRIYKEIYKYYDSIIRLSNEQLNEKFRYAIEDLINEYNEIDSTSETVDLLLDKELFVTGGNMLGLRTKAFVIFYELMYRLFNIIDLSPFDNKIPNKTYISKFFNIEYITLSNDIVYILLKNCKNFLVFDLKKKISSIEDININEPGSYKYHTVKLINKVRGLYMYSFGYPITKIKYDENNMIVFLENGDIVITGENTNGKIKDTENMEYLKFHPFINRYEENTKSINKMEIGENFIITLYDNGKLYVNGLKDNLLVFNDNNVVSINDNFHLYKPRENNDIFKDFYVSKDEKNLITITNENKIYISIFNEENSVLGMPIIGDMTEITNTLKTNIGAVTVGDSFIKCINDNEQYEILSDIDINKIRQIILTNSAIIFAKENKVFIKGTFSDFKESLFCIKIYDEEIIEEGEFYINKLFEGVDDNIFIECIKKNIDGINKFSYYSIGNNHYCRNGNDNVNSTELSNITNQICVNSIGQIDRTIRITKFVSDLNRTIILNSSNVVLGAGLNGGYFCELSNPIEVEEGQIPIPDIENVETRFTNLLPTSDIGTISDIIVNKEKENSKAIVIIPNVNRAHAFGTYYYLGFKTGGGYAVTDQMVESKDAEIGSLNKVTNISTSSIFCSQNCIYSSNPFFDLVSNMIMQSDPDKLNTNNFNITQLTKTLIYIGDSIIDYKYKSFIKKAGLYLDTSDCSRNRMTNMNNKNTSYFMENLFNFTTNRFLMLEYSYADTYSYIAAFLNMIGMMSESFSSIKLSMVDIKTFIKCIDESNDINQDLPYDKDSRINEKIRNQYRSISINC